MVGPLSQLSCLLMDNINQRHPHAPVHASTISRQHTTKWEDRFPLISRGVREFDAPVF